MSTSDAEIRDIRTEIARLQENLAELRAILLEVVSAVRDGDVTNRVLTGRVGSVAEGLIKRAEADGALRRTFSDGFVTIEELVRAIQHAVDQNAKALAVLMAALAPKPKDAGPAVRLLRALLNANPRVILAIGITAILIGIGAGLGYAVYRLLMHAGDLP